LRTDYIDLYWMHFWDPNTPIEETLRALDDLVRAGKVRYIGASDTPAWKVAQAQVLAELRGWSPFAGLQIEYSLIERTVEGELVPMALEFGLGITPWSPLRGGVLSGKYTRANAAAASPDRGDRVMSFLTERNLTIIDELIRIAGEAGTTPAAVALAWVQSRPGVASTIIGARRLDQLDQNLAALEVTLDGPAPGSPQRRLGTDTQLPGAVLQMIPTFAQGGTTVNGTPSVVWPLAPKPSEKRY
jgi:aryl-alcohol dehydrogenase-like predicted oxidoreductase